MAEPEVLDDPFERLTVEAVNKLKLDGTDFNTALAAHMETTEEPAAPEEPEPEPDAEPEEPAEPEAPASEQPAPEPTPQPAATDSFTIDGVEWTRDQLAAAARFAASARRAADRDAITAQHLADVLAGRWTPEVAAPAPPPELDLEDPGIAYLAQRLDQIQNQVASYTSAQQAVYDDVVARRQAEAQSIYTRARASFQSEHALSDADMARVDDNAARLGVLKPLMDSGLDLLSATTEAFTVGLRSDSALYERDLANTATAERDLRTRKAKANSLSAGSGASPREAAKPQDPVAAMVAEVRDAMFPPS